MSSAFIEVLVKGDARALLEAGAIGGIITSPGQRMDTVATPEKPLAIMLRGGATLEVYGLSGAELIARSVRIKQYVRAKGYDIAADLLDHPNPELAVYGHPDASAPT